MEIPESEIKWSFARSGGKGGQNVNKVETKVFASWNVWRSRSISAEQRDRLISSAVIAKYIDHEGTITVVSQTHRTQERNRADALEKLNLLVREGLKRPKKRRKTRVPKGVKERRLKTKKFQSEKKQSRKKSAGYD